MCLPSAEKRWIDAHVHLLALPTETNGCMISPRLKNGLLTRILARRRGWNLDDPESFNRQYLHALSKTLASSSFVSQAVLRAMAERRLPLLSQIGYEFSLIGKDQSQGDLGRLRLALDQGVTVIAAHGASFGCFVYEKFLDERLMMFNRYPNLRVDVSALTLPNRVGQFFVLRELGVQVGQTNLFAKGVDKEWKH